MGTNTPQWQHDHGNEPSIKDELKRIRVALTGDKDLGIEGVVSRLSLIEGEVKYIKRFIYKYHWMIVGGVSVLSTIISLAFALAKR